MATTTESFGLHNRLVRIIGVRNPMFYLNIVMWSVRQWNSMATPIQDFGL